MRTREYPYKLKIGDTVYAIRNNNTIKMGVISGVNDETVEIEGYWYDREGLSPSSYMAELHLELVKLENSPIRTEDLYKPNGTHYQTRIDLQKMIDDLIEVEIHFGMRVIRGEGFMREDKWRELQEQRRKEQ